MKFPNPDGGFFPAIGINKDWICIQANEKPDEETVWFSYFISSHNFARSHTDYFSLTNSIHFSGSANLHSQCYSDNHHHRWYRGAGPVSSLENSTEFKWWRGVAHCMWAAHVLGNNLLHEYSSLYSDTKPRFNLSQHVLTFMFIQILVPFQFRIQVQVIFISLRIITFRPILIFKFRADAGVQFFW